MAGPPPPSLADRRLFDRNGGKVDARADMRVALKAAEEWGVLSVLELRSCGLSMREIDRRVAAGWLAPSERPAVPQRRTGSDRGGIRKLRRILATGPAPTRNELEDVVLDLILSGGLAHTDVDVSMTLDGRRVVPDFRWPAHRLIVEADSAKWHEGELAKEDDAERQALLEAHRERLVRVTWEQAIARPAQTLARFKAAGAPTC